MKRARLRELMRIIEQRLAPSLVTVVPRPEAKVFSNQILLELSGREYVITITETRNPRRMVARHSNNSPSPLLRTH